jgi:uncharacterized protein (DUF1015 family)
VPVIRPFRALRFDATSVGDVAAVVAPSYDTIDAAEHERLLARHPANVVRVDLPETRHGDEPDDRFRRAARSMAEWRSGAILHKDPHPSVYLYACDPVDAGLPPLRGYFARLRLEALDGESEVDAESATTAMDFDDRYKLLRATGVNTSPVVAVYDDPDGATAGRLSALSARPPEIDLVDEAGTRHRVWAVAADGGGETADAVQTLIRPAAAGRVHIVAGRSTYDAALRYRDERRMSRSCEEDPAFDYLLALLVAGTDRPTIPTALTGLVINPHEW